MTTTLKFGEPNAKLKKMIKAKLGLRLKTFTLPAGHTCPGAKDCLSRADRITGKVTDSEETEFRCFMASAEARSPSLRKLVWHNLELLQDALSYSDGHERAADLICQSLPEKFDIMRVHVGGDYFSRNYFLAWCLVAERNTDKVFYSYTKSLPIIGGIPKPDNLVLTASRGGKWDNLIDEKIERSAGCIQRRRSRRAWSRDRPRRHPRGIRHKKFCASTAWHTTKRQCSSRGVKNHKKKGGVMKY